MNRNPMTPQDWLTFYQTHPADLLAFIATANRVADEQAAKIERLEAGTDILLAFINGKITRDEMEARIKANESLASPFYPDITTADEDRYYQSGHN